MLDLATLPLSLHKETAGSGLSRLDILRAKYAANNNIAQQQSLYQKLLVDFPEHNRNQYLMNHIHAALNLNIDYGTIKADLLKLPQINKHRVFEPHDHQRIVIATNVAETSLTVPDRKSVV